MTEEKFEANLHNFEARSTSHHVTMRYIVPRWTLVRHRATMKKLKPVIKSINRSLIHHRSNIGGTLKGRNSPHHRERPLPLQGIEVILYA
jgi:hypothetical protein